jgi:hypothetical protein
MSLALGRVPAGTLAVILAASAGTAAAQQLQVPGVVAPPVKGPSGFVLNANVAGGWDSNPAWLTQPRSSLAGYGGASLAKTWSTPSFSVTADGSGQASIFKAGVAANRYDYGGGLAAAGALDSRTNLALRVGANVQHNDQLFNPLTAGLLLPVTKTKALTTSADVSRRVGSRSQIGIAGSWARLQFEGAGLSNGTALAATARYSYNVSPRGQLSANYGYQTNDYERGGRTHVQTLAAGYGSALGARSKLTFSAGSDVRTLPGATSATWSLYLNSSYSVTGRHTAFVAAYRRGVNPGPGLGQDRLLGIASASFSATPNTWFSLILSGSHGNNSQGTGTNQTYTTDEASASLRARLNRDLGLVLLNEYRQRGAVATFQGVTDYRISLALAYARTFR